MLNVIVHSQIACDVLLGNASHNSPLKPASDNPGTRTRLPFTLRNPLNPLFLKR